METAITTTPDTAIERISAHQNSMASPNVAAQRPLAETVEAFLIAAAGKSERTRRAYAMGVGLFLQFLERERGQYGDPAWRPYAQQVTASRQANGRMYHKQVWEFSDAPSAVLWLVDAALLDKFIEHLLANGNEPSTAELRASAARTFLAVAYRDNIITDEQARQMDLKPYKARRARSETSVGRRLSPAEVRKLRAAVDTSTNKGKRDAAILDCMLFAGLRRAEVAGLTGRDIQPDGGRHWLILRGKGDKARRVKIHDTLYKSITGWRNVAGNVFGDDAPLFLSVNRGDNIQDTQIADNVIERIVREYAQAADLGRIAPHDLRRTCARNAYDNGASLLQVQQMLGHSDPKTTSRYIGADFNDDDTAVDRLKY